MAVIGSSARNGKASDRGIPMKLKIPREIFKLLIRYASGKAVGICTNTTLRMLGTLLIAQSQT